MAFSCRVLADSISPSGVRLTTVEATYPRFILAEVNTHRMLSRNSASSRAIPIAKMIEAVEKDPAMFVWWGKNQSGMQAREELTGGDLVAAKIEWLLARDDAVTHARNLIHNNLHKQNANRILEPFMWTTSIISATDWDNFFHLRRHPDAQPEIREIADMMSAELTYLASMIEEEISTSSPVHLDYGEWHLPLLFADEKLVLRIDGRKDWKHYKMLSAGRCARVSLLSHDGKRDPSADINLHDRLCDSDPLHMSPFEHQATPNEDFPHDYLGNFCGWIQYRKEFENENYRGPWAWDE